MLIRPTTISELFEHAAALFEEHHQELAIHKSAMILQPDRARYELFEEQGTLLVLGVWDEERMVGYSVNILQVHPHYTGLHVCTNDVFFLTKGARGLGLCRELLKETCRSARLRAPAGEPLLVMMHAKKDTPFGHILERHGYGVEEVTYSKVIQP